MKIRIGIIGLGKFAQQHLACLEQLNNVQIVAVCDIDLQKAQSLAQGKGIASYSNWELMLENEQLDAVDVITPGGFHYDIVVSALQKGLHVFVEKPLELDIAKAEMMVETWKNSNKLLMIGHITRFDPRYMHAKQLVSQGIIGRTRAVYSHRYNGIQFFHNYRKEHPLYSLGIHDVDLCIWLADSNVIEVYAHHQRNQAGDIDLIRGMLKFENGTTAFVEAHWLLPEQAPSYMDARLTVTGEKGSISVNDPEQTVSVLSHQGAETPDYIKNHMIYGQYTGNLLEELKHFTDCIITNQPSAILKPEDALYTLRISSELIRSAEEGRPIFM